MVPQHGPFSLHTMLEGPWLHITAFPTHMVRPLDESQGSSPLQGHSSWLMCAVALRAPGETAVVLLCRQQKAANFGSFDVVQIAQILMRLICCTLLPFRFSLPRVWIRELPWRWRRRRDKVRACHKALFVKVIDLESERILISEIDREALAREYWEDTCSPAQFEGY